MVLSFVREGEPNQEYMKEALWRAYIVDETEFMENMKKWNVELKEREKELRGWFLRPEEEQKLRKGK